MTLGREGKDIELPGPGSDGSGRAARWRAYRADPPAGRGRAVLVLGRGARLHDGMRDACDRLARGGLVALGVGHADSAETPLVSEALVEAGVAALLGASATEGARVGVLGEGDGGSLALRTAAQNARIGAVVCVDTPLPAPGDLLRSRAGVLAVFAERGEATSPLAARAFAAALEERGCTAHVRIEPGVAPGFLDPANVSAHDAVVADGCWEAIRAFLHAEL